MSVTLPLCEPILPVGPDAGRAQVLDRFLTEPELELLPVVENNRPVGLITRGRFALGLLQDGALSGSIQAMTLADPVIITPLGVPTSASQARNTLIDSSLADLLRLSMMAF